MVVIVEAVIAPEYGDKALAKLKEKQNLRVLLVPKEAVNKPFNGFDYKRVRGGILVQEADNAELDKMDKGNCREHRVDTILNLEKLEKVGCGLPDIKLRMQEAFKNYK